MANVCFECSLTSCAFRFHSNSITVIGLIHAALSLSLLYTIDLNLAPCVTQKKAQLLQQQRAAARAESPAAIQRDQKLGSRSDTLGHFT